MSDSEQQPLALVIDDEMDIRQIARMALRADGWRVIEAADGREGLKQAIENKPVLILVDMMLPSMSGVEFCRKAIQDSTLADAAYLMISGISEKASALADFWELPIKARDFLRKPFDTRDLTRRARRLVGDAGPVEPAAASKPRAAKPLREETPSLFPTLPELPDETMPRPAPHPMDDVPLRKPARAAASAPAPAAPARPSLLGGESDDQPHGYRILLIDDDEDIRFVFKTHLSRFHTVETAVNGMEGIKAMEAFRPDFIVTDVNMPVMNGLETAEAIRQHPMFSSVPIFFVTGETDETLPRKAFEIGGNLYLRKPIEPERLLKCINYFLKETRLAPGSYLGDAPGPKSLPAAKPSARAAEPRLRVLVVDFNIEDHHLLKRLLGDEGVMGSVPGGPFEVFWVENPRVALGNMNRWEPDLILYNPRNPNVDAIAFGQTLRLNKELSKTHLWLIGARFYDADVTYSNQGLKHDVIRLDQDDATLSTMLSRALNEAQATMRPKTQSWHDLRAEEIERLRQLQQSDAKRARERDLLRKRYRSVQDFIDTTLQ